MSVAGDELRREERKRSRETRSTGSGKKILTSSGYDNPTPRRRPVFYFARRNMKTSLFFAAVIDQDSLFRKTGALVPVWGCIGN